MKHDSFNRSVNWEEVIKGYLNAALWTNELDYDYDIEDISKLSIIKVKIDIKKFIHNLKRKGILEDLREHISDNDIGHDFWLTTSGHGSGFWDRNLGELGYYVSKICEKFVENSVYVGDDKKIYIE